MQMPVRVNLAEPALPQKKVPVTGSGGHPILWSVCAFILSEEHVFGFRPGIEADTPCLSNGYSAAGLSQRIHAFACGFEPSVPCVPTGSVLDWLSYTPKKPELLNLAISSALTAPGSRRPGALH